MKREIKFRGRDFAGTWWKGDLLHEDGNTLISPLPGMKVYVDPDTIGQFTGLRDTNGTEIYEGDILDLGDEVKAYYDMDTITVEWIDKYACFGQVKKRPVKEVEEEIDIIMGSESISPDDYKDWYDYIGSTVLDLCHMLRPSFSQPMPEFKVIGNIHDNPELLEGGEQ